MKLRKYREGDLETLTKMGTLAFGGSVSDWEGHYKPEKNPRLDLDGVYVVEEDGEARAATTVLPMEVFVDGRPVAMGGISAVKTHPAYRRRGYAGELMRASLRGMREQGTHLSMLWPFAHAFYRVYGWELTGETIEYKLKPTDLATSSEQKLIRAYREGDLPRIMALFDERAARHSCCVQRPEKVWRGRTLNRREKEDQIAVYERDGNVEGYIIYRTSDWREGRTPPRALTVVELTAATTRAERALLSFLAAQDPSTFEIKHWTPRGEPLHPYLVSSHVKAEIAPEFMLRLVDVEGALKTLDRRIDDPLVLEVADDVIPENAGEYTVGDSVSRGAESEHRVALDVRQLAQLYAGYLPAGQLAVHERIKPNSEKALGLLEAFFPVGDPWVSDPDHF